MVIPGTQRKNTIDKIHKHTRMLWQYTILVELHNEHIRSSKCRRLFHCIDKCLVAKMYYFSLIWRQSLFGWLHKHKQINVLKYIIYTHDNDKTSAVTTSTNINCKHTCFLFSHKISQSACSLIGCVITLESYSSSSVKLQTRSNLITSFHLLPCAKVYREDVELYVSWYLNIPILSKDP